MNEVIFFEINNRSPAEDFLFSLDEKTLSKCPHGFKKKKSKILPKDIAIARNRLTLI